MSINKSELRIGNLVVLAHESKFPVAAITEIKTSCVCAMPLTAKYDEYVMYKDLMPIELSDEWLERLGFIKEESSDIEERVIWSIQVANNTSLYYDKDHGDKQWYLSVFDNNNHFQNDFWNKPEHIHSLQNLFYCLSGEELTIKEPINE